MVLLFQTLILLITSSRATEWVNDVPQVTILQSTQEKEHRNWFVRLDGVTSPMPFNLVGGGIVIGRRFEFVTLDLQAKFITGTYDSITPEKDLAALNDASAWPVSGDPAAEINNRLRLPSTPFTGLFFGPGFGAHSKLLQGISPRLSEHGRAGGYFGLFNDGTNATAFTAILLFAEASILYDLTESGAWTLGLTASATMGRMVTATAASESLGRVPVLFGNMGLSIAHWF